jgi:hypothetical protein
MPDDSAACIGLDAPVDSRLGDGKFAGGSSGESGRYAAFATNPVSRFNALDELEDIGADTEDRYAHVAEHHTLGCSEIASGYDLADFELMAAPNSNAGSDSRSALR